MGALEAAPAGVLMPRGCDDIAGPPPGASHARQPEWLRRHTPADYVPPPLLTSLALEAGRWESQAPTACITGARVGDDYVIVSAAGPARDLIAVSSLPATPGPASPAALNLQSLQTVGHRPWYARASAPLLQLSLSSAAPGGWVSQGSLPNAPILAARSAGAVDFWQLECHEKGWGLGRQLGTASGSSSNGSGNSEFVDVAWGRHLTQRCAVLRRDGSVLEVTLSPSSAAASLAWAPDTSLTAALPFLDPSGTKIGSSGPSPAVLRCAFTSCHPRQLLVSLHSTLGLVDLRGGSGRRGGMLSVFSCPQGEWISALAAATDPEAPPPAPFLAAAATPSRVLVFDLRRPQVPLVEWEHGMEAEGKAKNARALRFAAPDALQWLPAVGAGRERRLLASCAWSGRGVVCEWEERHERGGVAVGPGGQLRETGPGERQEESDTFFFEPAWWTQAKAMCPPQLLYDLKIGYPKALSKAAGEAAAAQQRRAAARALLPGGAGGGEEQAQTLVMLLPEARHGPALLGATALSSRQWANRSSGTAASDGGFMLAMLSPTQEIVLAAVRPRQSTASNATSSPLPPLPPLLRPAPLKSPDSDEESGEGEVVFVGGRAQVRKDPQAELAAAAAAEAPPLGGEDDEAGGAQHPLSDSAQPRIRVKQAPLVDLPLHRWLLEEAIRQHGLSPQRHIAEFGDLEGEEVGGVVAAAQVAFTAQEAWQALTAASPHAQAVLEGHVPSLSGPGRRKKGAGRGQTGASHVDTLTAALTRGGLLPLVPGQRAVPVDSLEPLNAQNQALPLFPGPSFAENVAAAVAAVGAAPPDPQQASTSAPPRAHVPPPLKLRRATASPPAAVAARSGVPTPWGAPPSQPAPSAAAAGSELVYIPHTDTTSGQSTRIGRGSKAPSAEAQAALEQLRGAWREAD